MLGVIVGHVGGSCFPINCKLLLFDPIAKPIEAHVCGFGSFLLCGAIEDSFGALIVGLDGCGRLRVA